LFYLLVLVTGLSRVRRVLARRKVRRGLDAATGTALIGFSVSWQQSTPNRAERTALSG
jgi:hypothetical protein